MPSTLSPAAEALRKLCSPAPEQKTQQQIADDLGVKQQAVSLWMRGITRPGLTTRLAIEQLTGIPADAWMTAEDRKELKRISRMKPWKTAARKEG
jgi:transcriptional regulator with XRE-family HTH domain